MDSFHVRKEQILSLLEKIKSKVIRAKAKDSGLWEEITALSEELGDKAYTEATWDH